MMHVFHLNQSLQSIFWPNTRHTVKNVLLTLLGALLLAGASQLSLPLQPVPLTFQSATVVLLGMTLGVRRGVASVAFYLMSGAMGLPLFAGFSAGLHVFFGPTGGYLLGFVPAVAVSGYLTEHGWGKHLVSAFIASLLGVFCIFVIGAFQLAQFIGWDNAWLLGVKPFLFTEILKLVFIAWVAKLCWTEPSIKQSTS